jgi:hypothetical protein
MITIYISSKLGIVEKIMILVYCSPKDINIHTTLFKEYLDVIDSSYDDMSSINPSSVEHEIPTYDNARPIQKILQTLNPNKVATIKEKVEKLLK